MSLVQEKIQDLFSGWRQCPGMEHRVQSPGDAMFTIF